MGTDMMDMDMTDLDMMDLVTLVNVRVKMKPVTQYRQPHRNVCIYQDDEVRKEASAIVAQLKDKGTSRHQQSNQQLYQEQALTGTRYPTRPGLFFSYPNRTRKFFQNFSVQGSSYICHY